ncbi:MAG: hypothetical protein M3Y31_00665 [Gemmatimonadota bacterium]|nr:hypothetical protein [Gemmatimonadota bacterium]
MLRPARLLGLALAAAALACGGDEPPVTSTMSLGQTYTDWFYAGRVDDMRGRFTPELQGAFGTRDSLRLYHERTVGELGRETGAAREEITEAGPMQVYARVAAFERAPDPMLLEWAIDSAGAISGFVLRPAPGDAGDAAGDSAQ